MDRHPQPIGKRIKRARERRRWTQAQLGSAIGVTQKTVDNWEHDKTYPKSAIGALEEVLSIVFDDEPEAVPPALADLWPPQDNWEADVFGDADLPDHMKRELITGSRAARAAYRSRKAARAPRQGQAAG